MNQNKFDCWVCGKKDRQRGIFVRVIKGMMQGFAVKICRAEACQKAAKKGDLTAWMNAGKEKLKLFVLD